LNQQGISPHQELVVIRCRIVSAKVAIPRRQKKSEKGDADRYSRQVTRPKGHAKVRQGAIVCCILHTSFGLHAFCFCLQPIVRMCKLD
jgi:hypothetical protein